MRVVSVEVRDGYKVELTFDDGTQGVIDLGDLVGRGVFDAWRDRAEFEKVEVGSVGELSWPCGVDLCADALYLRLTGKHPEEVFPALDRGKRCA